MADLDLYTVSYVDASRAAISAAEIGESLARNPEFLRILDGYTRVVCRAMASFRLSWCS